MLKKILIAALLWPLVALAQSYPSPTFNNVTVNGTLTGKVNSTGSTITNATITGGTISGLSSPLPVASGGTNSASASGTALDNIAGFSSTGFVSRTGAGAYSFTASTGSGSVVLGTSPAIATPTITGSLTATGLVTTADLATQAANTVLANATGSSASPTAFAMPSCSGATNALAWTSGSGFTCNSAISASTIAASAWASPGAIGSTAPNTGAFTSLSAGISNPSLNYLSGGTRATARTYGSKFGDVVSVKDFGATGNGSTDDTAAITAADTYARSINAILYFPAGTYMVTQLVINTGANWLGDGRQSTIIKEITGTNLDLIYGVNSSSNWGSATPSGYAVGYTIRNITLNENWNTGSGNTSGSCLAVYGPRPILENVFITNCAEYGMRTEYTDSSNGGTDTFTMEGYLENVKIDTTGKHGWWNNGPHDTVTVGLQIVDAGQATTGTWDGLYYDAKSTGRNIGTHVWSRAASNRMAYDLVLVSGSEHEFTGGCNFEGANTIVDIASQNNIFDKSTRYYSAWNGTTILFSGPSATRNIVMGYLDAPGTGRPATVGIQFGASSGDFVADNTIDVRMNGQENGNLFFNSTYDGGYNRIKVEAYNTTAASISGTPNTLDDIDVLIHNSGGMSHINNRSQCGQITTGASASGTWTYPYAFAASPIVTFSPQGPGGSLTSGMWISSVSATSVTIFNNNSVSTTANVCARATN